MRKLLLLCLLLATPAWAQYDLVGASDATSVDGLLAVDTATALTGTWTCTTTSLTCTEVAGGDPGNAATVLATGNTVVLCGDRYKVNGEPPSESAIVFLPHRNPATGDLRRGVDTACTAQTAYLITHGIDGTARPVRDGDGTESGLNLSTAGIDADAITEGGQAVPNVTDNLSVFAATTSAQLAGVVSDETGSAGGGVAVFSASPALTGTPAIGVNGASGSAGMLVIRNGGNPGVAIRLRPYATGLAIETEAGGNAALNAGNGVVAGVTAIDSLTYGARTKSTGIYAWTNDATYSGTLDTELKRDAAGVVASADGSGNYATHKAAGLVLSTVANGATQTDTAGTEVLTLSTIGATSDTTANLLPANSEIEWVTYRITSEITGVGVTGFTIGDGTTAARFCAAQTTLAAGTTGYCYVHRDPTVATAAEGPVQSAAAKVRVTVAGATPTAGAIRLVVYYRQWSAPSG